MAHQALDVHAVDAEGRLRLRHAARVRLGQVLGAQHGAHATSTAAADRLDHDAGTVLRLLGEEGLRLGQRDGAGAAGHHGHVALLRQRACTRLVAEERQLLGRGADEDQPRVGTSLCEVGAFRKEAVARVHRIAGLRLRHGDECRNVEIGRGAGRVERDGRVGQLHMQCLRVVARMHCHAGDSGVLQGAHQAHGDFAAVGDEDFTEHGVSAAHRRTRFARWPFGLRPALARERRGWR